MPQRTPPRWYADSSQKWAGWFLDAQHNWQYSQPHRGASQAPPGPRQWTCNQCKCTNTSPKTCSTCGLKRSYGDVARAAANAAAPPAAPTVAAQQNTVRSQLNNLTESLANIHIDTMRSAGTTKATPEPPPARRVGEATPTKNQLQARVKQLEAALSALPEDVEDLAAERESIAARLEGARRELRGSRPIGARIDGARAALQRSKKRQEDAAQALAAAQLLNGEAAAEVADLEEQLHDLEMSLAVGTDMTDDETAQPASKAYEILQQMIEHLKEDSCVQPGHVQAATDHVQKLFDGFRLTKEHADAARAAAANAPAAAAERRHSVKGPPMVRPVARASGPLVRHHGKQPRKELITDYFSKKRVITVVGRDVDVSIAADGAVAGFTTSGAATAET